MRSPGAAMPTQIALLGLNHLTGSIGLALRPRENLHLVGFDPDAQATRLAHQRGVFHRAAWNLLNAIEAADLVVLALPLADQREVLRAVALDLRSGCVVMSVGPLLRPPLAWSAEVMPPERHFVACHPLLHPAHLMSGQSGLDAARADLFVRGLLALAPAPACAPEALKAVGDLALLLGAAPYFVDPAEHDGLMGGTEALPLLLAWALMRAAAASAGWGDMRKVADRGFATATAALSAAEGSAVPLNRESALRYLDLALAELQSVRAMLAQDKGAAVESLLAEAAALRAEWLADRERGAWDTASQSPVDLPTAGESLARLFMGSWLARRRGQREEP